MDQYSDNYVNQLIEWDRKFLWHPFTQMKDWMKIKPLIVKEASGNYLYDVEGNRYLDVIGSLWTNVHGHQKKEITEAIINQANKVAHSTLLGFCNEPSILLAKKLVEISPSSLKRVFYSDSGSTAVEIALKMAFQFWQQINGNNGSKRKKYVTFQNAYHGDTIGSVSVGGMPLFHAKYSSLLFDSIPMQYPCRFHWQGDKEHCLLESINALRAVLNDNKQDVVAIVIEPLVQGAAGMYTAEPGFLSEVRKLCDDFGVLLIVDEVATGFGKTGSMFACEQEEVEPDIMCVAKGLSGGYLPLAATLTSEKVFNAFLGDYEEQKTFFHGHTFTGNQLACAAAIASLDLFESEKTLNNLQPKIKLLGELLEDIKMLSHVGDVRRVGIMTGVELVKDKNNNEIYNWQEQIGVKVCRDMVEKGFFMRPLGNVIILMPPLAITEEEIKALIGALKDSIVKVTE